MTQGILLFAFNNEDINYGSMAVWASRNINRCLNKPVSLVTNYETKNNLDEKIPNWKSNFDRVIFQESISTHKKRYLDRHLTFHNLNRINAWELTPYDETIVIDTDVLIQSDQLNKLWNSNESLIICSNSSDIFGRRDAEFEYVNPYGIKFYWATIFYFRKNKESQMFFDLCKDIKSNYTWNRKIHGLPSGPVRNDHIWSIAVHNLNHTSVIPWNIPYSSPSDRIVKMSKDSVTILGDQLLTKVNQDIHLMNKFDLLSLIEKDLINE